VCIVTFISIITWHLWLFCLKHDPTADHKQQPHVSRVPLRDRKLVSVKELSSRLNPTVIKVPMTNKCSG
ncbi:MAG: hypothetical protein ACPF9Z_08935, partial [Paracoccaceae bacterium]